MSAITVTAVELVFAQGASDRTYRVFTIGGRVTIASVDRRVARLDVRLVS